MGFPRQGRRLLHHALPALLLVSGGAAAMAATQFAADRSYPVASSRSGRLSPWEQAERTRDAFEAIPENRRTSAEYTRVLDGFRAIYHERPGDGHAAEAVNAVAELLAEEGRGEHNRGLLHAAVRQYEFLRTQYPGSSLRVGALLAEAQIEQNDLGDTAAARERYTTFLTLYPRSSVAEQARAGLVSLDRGDATLATQRQSTEPARASATVSPGRAPVESSSAAASTALTPTPSTPVSEVQPAAPIVRATAPPRAGKPATVTGIRHWSTPSYTRVAIDLGDAVEYQAARVPSPDRIFFDLHGARLAQDLVGKSFSVTDDGFLKRIRVAQSGTDLARIVLDVNDVTEYSAFLLPNPYRLIIDIHGRSRPGGPVPTEVDAPARPAVTVPNTRAVNGGSGADVARLSEQPGKVEATAAPTSQPIAAVVKAADHRALPSGSMSAADQAAGSRPPAVPVDARAQAAQQPGSAPAGLAQLESGGRRLPESSTAATVNTGGQAGAGLAPVPLPGASLGPAKRGRKGRTSSADSKVVGDPATPARAAVKTADGQTSLVRALGLKINRIVIDAGHGGHDSGTLGVGGLEEKDVVLDVALRLGKLLHDRMGAEVIYTRSDDTFVPLETRTAIANKAQADLFLSIHANSSPDASARGVETYYLNFTAQPDALEVAARENAVSGQSISQLSDLVKKIALKDKIAESREFAADVEGGLYGGLARGNEGLRNRGIKKAPFVVLIGANMPSVLAEISFVTNPKDAGQLRQPDYRQRVAESLCRGVARYAGGLSGPGVLPATAVERAAGQ